MPNGILEPSFQDTNHPEEVLRSAVISFLQNYLLSADINFTLFENYGLDIALHITHNQYSQWKFIELKAFVGHRNNGVGVGNRVGEGSQIDLLKLAEDALYTFDKSIRWILVDGTKINGERRFAFFDSIKAKNSLMSGGEVRPGVQNNLKVSCFEDSYLTWLDLCELTKKWLIE